MSEEEEQDRTPAPAPPPPPEVEVVEGDALDQVVDDFDARREAAEWADGELLKERLPETLVEDLVAAGWTLDAAETLVEAARVRTRRARGVMTRDDVAREMSARYRKGMRMSWFAGLPNLASAWRLMVAIGNLMTLRRWRK